MYCIMHRRKKPARIQEEPPVSLLLLAVAADLIYTIDSIARLHSISIYYMHSESLSLYSCSVYLFQLPYMELAPWDIHNIMQRALVHNYNVWRMRLTSFSIHHYIPLHSIAIIRTQIQTHKSLHYTLLSTNQAQWILKIIRVRHWGVRNVYSVV